MAACTVEQGISVIVITIAKFFHSDDLFDTLSFDHW